MARFGLKEKAERLGAEVALLESPRMVEVAALAGRRWPMALACSAWLMGWDPGAQVAGTVAGHGLPFLVISAGTRHHLAQLPVVAGDVRSHATAPTGRRRGSRRLVARGQGCASGPLVPAVPWVPAWAESAFSIGTRMPSGSTSCIGTLTSRTPLS